MVGQHLSIFGKLHSLYQGNTRTTQEQQLWREYHVAFDRLVKSPSGRPAESSRAAVPKMLLERRIPAEAAPAGAPTIAGPVQTADYTEANEIQDYRASQEPV
jgi:hypothetical protein